MRSGCSGIAISVTIVHSSISRIIIAAMTVVIAVVAVIVLRQSLCILRQ